MCYNYTNLYKKFVGAKLKKLDIGNLEELGMELDLGESAKRKSYPRVKFKIEEEKIIKEYADERRLKKGTLVKVAIGEFLKELAKEGK